MPKAKTHEQFLGEARTTWGDRWDYSKTQYTGIMHSLTFICRDHGEFTQMARSHLRGNTGCPKCDTKTKMSPETFMKRCLDVWGDRWDYSDVDYKGIKSKISIVCREHGPYQQDAARHLMGQVGCPQCKSNATKTTEEFIQEAQPVWEGRWDYSKTEYTSTHEHVIIGCYIHGDFSQRPKTHLKGAVGCPPCAHTAPLRQQDFLFRVKEMWGDRWDTSRAVYVNNSTKVTLSCSLHGDFEQAPMGLFVGAVGCSKCNGKHMDTPNFVKRASDKWGDRWDYSKTEYLPNDKLLTFICPEHGEFKQLGHDHNKGYIGCRQCALLVSGGEVALSQYVEDLGFSIQSNQRGLLKPSRQEMDIYVPEKQVAIEFHGLYYHSDKFKTPTAHVEKLRLAHKNGIRLVQVWEDDWNLRPHIVKEHIRQVLGVSELPKVSARKLGVTHVASRRAQVYLDENHIQGFVGASVYLGLRAEGEDIVALASFKKRGSDYELTRYATSAQVRGGHSKLVSYFEKSYSYGKLITFADLAFSDGGLYRSTGWVEDGTLAPDYSYLVAGERRHKFGYRLKRFKEDPELKYIEGMSERELADLNGLLRVYDAGKVRFIKPHPILEGDHPKEQHD